MIYNKKCCPFSYIFLLCPLKVSCETVFKITSAFLKLCLCSVVGYYVPIFLSSLDLTMERAGTVSNKNVDATWVIATQLLS